MRTRLPVFGAGVVALLSGCSGSAAATNPAPPPVQVAQLPASAAGGACQLLGYPTIEEHLGVRFDVAVARRVGDAATCVVQSRGVHRPDLVLSMSGPTSADAALFSTELRPKGAKPVKDLGRAAYWRAVAAGGRSPAAVEISWLSQDTRIITLRYTQADGAAQPAGKVAPRLVGLARAVDRSYG